MYLVLFFIVLGRCWLGALSFHVPITAATRSSSLRVECAGNKAAPIACWRTIQQHEHHHRRTLLFSEPDSEESGDSLPQTQQEDGAVEAFDGQGFAGYLAPYALALVGSLIVTALFVKFVLLDF